MIICINQAGGKKSYTNMQNQFENKTDSTSSVVKQQQSVEYVDNSNNEGHWTDEQHLKYIAFLSKHKVRFSCKLKKRKIRLFQSMSDYIGTRSTIQCRTHHQKFQNKLGSPKEIIQTFKEQIGAQKFKKCVKFQNKKRILWNCKAVPISSAIRDKGEIKVEKREVGVQTDIEPLVPSTEIIQAFQEWHNKFHYFTFFQS